jgi:uncharacterized membrane protein YhhN
LISAITLAIFFYGRSLRFTNLRRHIQVMTFVTVADILLVLGLVIFRDALTKVRMDMPWTLQVHVPIAVFTVILYVLTWLAGYRLWKGEAAARERLRALDRVLVPARILTLVTSLMVQFIDV